jgi:hypothetical protein
MVKKADVGPLLALARQLLLNADGSGDLLAALQALHPV